MKATSILTLALAFVTSAAAAQTVAPGTAPGAQTGNPSNMPSAGRPDQTTPDTRTDNASATDRKSKHSMAKSGKTKTSYDGKKMKTKM